MVRSAEVAADHDRRAVLDLEAHARRAEDVPGPPEAGLNTGDHFEGLAEVVGPEVVERGPGIVLRVEGQGGLVSGPSVAVGVLGLLLLQVAAVGEDDADELAGRRRAVHGTVEPVEDQPREVTAVVEMGVGQHHGVDGRRVHGEARPVLEPELLEPLEQAAVDEEPAPAVIEEELAPRHRAHAAEEGDRCRLRVHADEGRAPHLGRAATVRRGSRVRWSRVRWSRGREGYAAYHRSGSDAGGDERE